MHLVPVCPPVCPPEPRAPDREPRVTGELTCSCSVFCTVCWGDRRKVRHSLEVRGGSAQGWGQSASLSGSAVRVAVTTVPSEGRTGRTRVGSRWSAWTWLTQCGHRAFGWGEHVQVLILRSGREVSLLAERSKDLIENEKWGGGVQIQYR